MRVLIVGAGIMGLCAAWALRRGGHEVQVFEQGEVPNPQGSSVDQHRLIRFTYGAMTGYARMVREAYAAWERLWQDFGTTHYAPTGTLVVASDSPGWVEASSTSLAGMGLPAERLTAQEVVRRLPFLEPDFIQSALFTPTGGVLFAERIVRDLAAYLVRAGVGLRTGTQVAEVDPGRAAVRLADGGEEAGDALVVAAGPWAPRLVAGLHGRVTPSRQAVIYLEPPDEHRAAWQRAPALLAQIEAAQGGFYAIPPVEGMGLKIGDHAFTMQGDPDRGRSPTAEDVRRTLELAKRRIKGLERYAVQQAKTCFYSVAPEERFIAEPVERAWVLAGFSGHGFKFGACMGEALAAAIAGEQAPADLTAWAAGR